MPDFTTGACASCGISFAYERVAKRRKYCADCARRRRLVLACVICADTFIGLRGAKTCGPACHTKLVGSRRRLCEVCGREFSPSGVRSGAPKQRTCSRACGLFIRTGPGAPKLSCPIPWAECSCGRWFVNHGRQKCSVECSERGPRRTGLEVAKPCPDCGNGFSFIVKIGRHPKRCPPCTTAHELAEKRHWRKIRKQQAKSAAVDKSLRAIDVFERDGWVCQLCFEPIDRDADPLRDDWAPHVDHKVPQSLGGGWTWDNLQAAHRFCNIVKGNDPEFSWGVAG